MPQVVRTSESTRWYSQHCPKRTCYINKSQTLLPNRRQSVVRSKHAVLLLSTESSLCLPKKHSHIPVLYFFLKIRNLSAASQAGLCKNLFVWT